MSIRITFIRGIYEFLTLKAEWKNHFRCQSQLMHTLCWSQPPWKKRNFAQRLRFLCLMVIWLKISLRKSDCDLKCAWTWFKLEYFFFWSCSGSRKEKSFCSVKHKSCETRLQVTLSALIFRTEKKNTKQISRSRENPSAYRKKTQQNVKLEGWCKVREKKSYKTRLAGPISVTK